MNFHLNRKNERAHQQVLTPWEAYQKESAANQKQSAAGRQKKRIGDKLPKFKHQRNRKLVQKMTILLTSFILVILVMVYFLLPLSHVEKISVMGNQVLSKNQVIHYTGIKRGASIYTVQGSTAAIADRAEKRTPRIERLTVRVVHFNQVEIKLKEYATAGYAEVGNHYVEVLEDGTISTKRINQPQAGAPVYNGFKSTKTLRSMIKQYAQLPSDVKSSISDIRFDPTQTDKTRVHVFMNDGNEVYATIPTFAKKMAYYPSIANKMKANGVVNLEVGAYSYPFK
ncbi:cell division protein FtsQ/DivIB [Levilactobacillus bambusae]|uniref:Cell division protein DivIB n=1 Tax=Levilactobacillus bambusae TaxID=2024736 RepID=A0A2V1N1P2_9LACO|nr:cell division protein FtsQ/DivIB [Levilactobacillus bambusae]PWG00638.1 cell division septal protein [Levilactobacillus bambusae]